MGLRIWWVNLLLAGCAFFLVAQTFRAWTRESPAVILAEVPDARDAGAASDVQISSPRSLQSESFYRAVTRRNLLSPERTEYVPPPPEPEPEPEPEEVPEADAEPAVISGRRISLRGVVLAKGFKKALIDNPAPQQGDPARIWVSEGDAVGGVAVRSVERETVLLDHQGKTYRVSLYENDGTDASGRQRPGVSRGEDGPRVINTRVERPAPAVPAETEKDAADRGRREVPTPFD
ncbi:MAG: hypothetical protein ACLFRG_04345 [Desulfococcaceae bacterium]